MLTGICQDSHAQSNDASTGLQQQSSQELEEVLTHAGSFVMGQQYLLKVGSESVFFSSRCFEEELDEGRGCHL